MKLKFILFCLVSFLLASSLLSHLLSPPAEDYSKNRGHAWEKYDPSYFHKFQNVQSIIDEANLRFPIESRKNLAYFNYVAEILRNRFYHGYSHYNMTDNPLAFMAGKLVWNHLSAIVIPDDIMKHPMAACSQQAIVLMEIFNRQKVDFRKVTFKHHFTVEAKIDGDWRYFDTNLEPDFRNKRESVQNLLAENRLDAAYSNVLGSAASFYKDGSHIGYGKVNEKPAFKAVIFHKICYFLQSKGFLLSLTFVLLLYLLGFKIINRLFWSYKEKLA